MKALVMLAAAVLVAGCGDDEGPKGPAPGEFTVTLRDLPVLDAGQYYEAWVRFPEAAPGVGGLPALHGEGRLVGLGAFVVAAGGSLRSLTGGPAAFALAVPVDPDTLGLAEEILVSVREDAQADTTGPTILGGIVTGDDATGRCLLTSFYEDALGANLLLAAGSCVLATPTDGPGGNETQGIWFTGASGQPALSVPALGAGWTYEAWMQNGSEFVSVGRFRDESGPDSDGKGPEAGAEPGFDAPGSDFVQGGRNLADGETTVFITVEPAGEGGGGPLRYGAGPFPLRVLERAIPLNQAAREPMTLNLPASSPLPTGTVTFTR